MFRLKYLTLFYLVILVNAGIIIDKLLQIKHIQVTRVDGQCRGKNVAIVSTYRGINCSTQEVSVANLTVIVRKNLMNNIKLTVTIYRCKSRENLDSCEEYHKQQNLDYCKSIDPITSDNMLSMPLQPDYKCPIKKGLYHAYNFTFDLSPFLVFNLDDWYWKTKVEIFSPKENELLHCLNVEGYVISKSRHSKVLP